MTSCGLKICNLPGYQVAAFKDPPCTSLARRQADWRSASECNLNSTGCSPLQPCMVCLVMQKSWAESKDVLRFLDANGYITNPFVISLKTSAISSSSMGSSAEKNRLQQTRSSILLISSKPIFCFDFPSCRQAHGTGHMPFSSSTPRSVFNAALTVGMPP
jgi:hypothetical protein